MLQCKSLEDDPRTPENDTFNCVSNTSGKFHATEFDYIAHGMPYIYSEGIPGNHDHAWWEDGDREGYRCAYAFMYDKHPAPFGQNVIRQPGEGKFIAQTAWFSPEGAAYGKVNDAYMEEGQRYFDGKIANEGGQEISNPNEQSDCLGIANSLTSFDYSSYVPHGPDDIRIGLFRADGEISDIRDFTNLTVQNIQGSNDPYGWFEFVGFEDDIAVVAFIYADTMEVSHVGYYFPLNDGRMAVEVNGVTLQR